ncbi:MAG: YqiA/YcfP family alpha/beta fold hydrolase [Cyanobacteria bacterium P01_F01_bin.33]
MSALNFGCSLKFKCATVAEFLYLHGFASGPQSAKGVYLRDRFQTCGVSLHLLDLNQDNFTHLTLTRQIEQVSAALPTESITLIGSSLGGLTAAWVAERHLQVTRLVLLAPAFEFVARWRDRLGKETIETWRAQTYLEVYHYAVGKTLPLHYAFLPDASNYSEMKLKRNVPTLILHGRQDDVVPLAASQTYAASRPWVHLTELDSDHALGNVKAEIWQAIQSFCADDF